MTTNNNDLNTAAKNAVKQNKNFNNRQAKQNNNFVKEPVKNLKNTTAKNAGEKSKTESPQNTIFATDNLKVLANGDVVLNNSPSKNSNVKSPAPQNKAKNTNKTNVKASNNSLKNTNKNEKQTTTNSKANKPTQLQNAKQPSKSGDKKVKITFLGGVGEIGKNMTAIEYDNEIIVVDAGISFPGDDLPGIDIVVPDITYLSENKDKVKAFVITHGHEDHIGAVPFVLSEVNVPIYGTSLTLGLIENKLKEFPRIKHKAITVKPKQVLRLGNFTIEFIHVNHSIAGCLALFITTPAGNIFHSGDFKVDFTPVDGQVTDLQRIGELGKRGVDLMLCESTNVGRDGYSISESQVGKALGEIFVRHSKDRLFVATFASNIHRLQQLLDLAEKHKRKVVFSGRSMINVSEVALKLGELKFDKNILIDVDKVDKYAPNEILFLTTGSQGEAMSALTRMASGQFPKVNIGEGDTIVLSSSPIPGNEKSVFNTINRLFQRGANVIYDELEQVHASGHAFKEEIKLMHALVKPKFFLPVHGEYRHLKLHKELAIDMGMEARNIILPELGMQLEFNKNVLKKTGYVQAGQRLIDGLGVGDMDSSVLKDRKQLAEDGICVTVLHISSMTGAFSQDPFTITRGVVYQDEAEQFQADVKAHITKLMKDQDLKNLDVGLTRNNVRKALSNFIYKKTKRRPMILVIVMFD